MDPSPREKRALLILDLDGTLVDSFADIRASLEVAFQAVDITPPERVLELSRRGVPLETYYGHAVGRDPGSSQERERFAAFVSAYRDHYIAHQVHSRVYPGVVDTLLALRAQGLVLAVGTNKHTDVARSVLQALDLARHLDVIQGAEEVARKPDPAILGLIARQTGIGLDRAAMVGDTDMDMRAARSAGCTAIAVTYGGWSRTELAALGPDHVPHYLIDRFADLLDLVSLL